jgi:phosphatidylglycerophosphatase A
LSARLAFHLATVGGLGERLPAPGTTVGSLVAVVVFAALARWAPAALLPAAAAVLVLLLPLSVWACGREAARRGVADPGPVVLDEVVGQWLALVVVSIAVGASPPLAAIGVSFLLFRAFDVVKPWPIGRLERLPGGWGVVADDLAAGLAAALCHLVGLRLLS